MPSQGKSEGFDSCDWPSNLTQIGLKSSINQPVWPWNLMNDLEKHKAPLLYYIKICASFQIHWWIQTGVTVRTCSIRVKIGDFFVPCYLEIWWMTWKNNRAPLPYYIKLGAAFQSHWHLQTGVTVQKRSIRVKIGDFFCPGWLIKLTYDIEKQKGTSSILHQALCIISNPLVKSNLSCSLETLKSGKNWRFFCPAWPWKLTYDFEKQ